MKQQTISAYVEAITPALAKEWLQQQATYEKETGATRQRVLTVSRVDLYAREMSEGRWLLNGEPIQFNGRRLLNGQHRLNAIAKSGVTVQVLVVRGVPEEAFNTIDQGRPRSTSDLLRVAGLPYRSEIAGGARLVLVYDRYRTMHITPDRSPSHNEIVTFVSENTAAWIQAGHDVKVPRGFVLPTNVASALHFLTRERYPTQRDTFMSDIRHGINLRVDQPVRLLRERLIANQQSRAKLPSHIVAALTVKAWNAELTGRALKVLKFLDTEPFPELVC